MKNLTNAQIQIILDCGFQEKNLDTLKWYIDFLWQQNTELNLFSRQTTFNDLIENHIIDCLLPLKHFENINSNQTLNKVADLGTGGGLPAIIYAIHFPEIQFELFEKSPKKQIFLNSLKQKITNIQIKGLVHSTDLNVDLIMARGFKPIDVILELTQSHYEKHKNYFLLKARLEKINEELFDTQKKFKNIKSEIIKLNSPILEVERHLVLIN